MFKQQKETKKKEMKSLIISQNSWRIKCNKPCLTKESSFYACNALSNASLDGNISYLVGPSHPKPAMHKNKLKGIKELEREMGNGECSIKQNVSHQQYFWHEQAWQASIRQNKSQK